MRHLRHLGAGTLVALIGLLCVPSQTFAIPAFARKYATSCSTCHIAIPKLNAYGDAFRRNGYFLPQGDKAMVKEQPVLLGAKAWEELWPKAIWPGEMPGSVPLSAYMHQRAVWQNSRTAAKDTLLFDAPHELELLMGANLGRRIGFFGEWVLFEKEKNAEGLKRLFIQFSDMFTKMGLPENALNIQVGRIEVGTMEGLRDATKRLTMEHHILGDLRALENSGLAFAPKWRMRDFQSGIELNGILGHRFQYAAGVVNGESQTVSEGGDINRKDVYGRLAFKLGGLGLDGHGVGEALSETENWRDDSLTFGAFIYRGTTGSPGPTTENEFDRLGADIRWQWRALDVLGGFVRGDDELSTTLATDDVSSTAWFLEPSYRFLPWLIGLVRFDKYKVECDTGGLVGGICAPGGPGTPLKDARTINPHVLILIRPNVRFGLEALWEKRDWWKGVEPTGLPAPSTGDADDAESFKWVKANVQLVF